MNLSRSKVFVGLVGVLVLVWRLCSADPGPVALAGLPNPTATLPAWISVEPPVDCSQGCWQAETVMYEDDTQSGGNHHAYVQTREQGGEWVERPFHLAYPTGNDRALAKLPPEWGNIPVWACFRPDQGERGPYWLYAGDDPARSAIIRGIGLPYCHHDNIRVVFRYQETIIPPLPTATPTVTRTPTVTPTSTATAIPCQRCDRALFLPVISR